jgi:hypothetical protein
MEAGDGILWTGLVWDDENESLRHSISPQRDRRDEEEAVEPFESIAKLELGPLILESFDPYWLQARN